MAARVEVQCLETLAYYDASVKEYKNGEVHVGYPNAWKADEWCKLERVRRLAPQWDREAFKPAVGSVVEAMAQSGEAEPFGWWDVKIKSERGGFYIVTFISFDEYSEVMEKEKLRPKSPNPPLKPEDFTRYVLPLPRDLHDVHVHSFLELIEPSGIMLLQLENGSLIVHGSTDANKRFEALAKMTVKHMHELQQLEKKLTKTAETKKQLQQSLDKAYRIEFPIAKDMIGLCIGKGGKNITEALKLPGVLSINVDSDDQRAIIRAENEAAANRARDAIEFVEARVKVPQTQIGRIVGKNYTKLRELIRDSGVVRIRVDDPEGKSGTEFVPPKGGRNMKPWSEASDDAQIDLVIVGTRGPVQTAQHMLRTHCEHIKKVSELAEHERKAMMELKEVERDAGSMRKGQGGGRGAGGRNNEYKETGSNSGGYGDYDRRGQGRGSQRKQTDSDSTPASSGDNADRRRQRPRKNDNREGGNNNKQQNNQNQQGNKKAAEAKESAAGSEAQSQAPAPKQEHAKKGGNQGKQNQNQNGQQKPKREQQPKKEKKEGAGKQQQQQQQQQTEGSAAAVSSSATPAAESKESAKQGESGSGDGQASAKPQRSNQNRRRKRNKGGPKKEGAGAANGNGNVAEDDKDEGGPDDQE